MHYTFDRSAAQNLALIAQANMSDARYVPLDQSPAEMRDTPLPYLRQMHAVANSVAAGLVVQSRHKLDPKQWERLGSK